MKKSKVICLTAGFLIFVGIVIYLIGFAFGGRVYSIGINSDGFQVMDTNGTYSRNGVDPSGYNTRELELEAFENLDLQSDFGDIRIEESDHYGVSLGEYSNRPFRLDQTGKTLKISQKGGYSFQLFTLGFNHMNRTSGGDVFLTLYVPKGIELNSISIEGSTGDMELENLNAKEVNIQNDFGKVDLVNLNTSDIDVRISSGNITLSEVSTENLKLKGDFSEIYLEDCAITRETTMLTSTGNIKSRKTAFSQTNIKTDFGEISLDLTVPATDYNLDLETDFGEISVDNNSSGNQITTTSENAQTIKVRCSTGSIRITSPTE